MPTAPATTTADRPIRTGGLRAVDHAAQDVTAQLVGAEDGERAVGGARRRAREARQEVLLVRVGGREPAPGAAAHVADHEEDHRADAGAPGSEQDAGPAPAAPRRGQGRAGDAEPAGRRRQAAWSWPRRTRGSSAAYARSMTTFRSRRARRHGEDDGLDQRHVLVDHRLHGEPADAGIGEHRLRDDRAAQEVSEFEAERGHDGDRAVAEGVPEDHRPLADALGPRRPEEVLVQNLEHARPGDARGPRHGPDAERDGGQDERRARPSPP